MTDLPFPEVLAEELFWPQNKAGDPQMWGGSEWESYENGTDLVSKLIVISVTT